MGLTGTTNADENERYRNADGTINTSEQAQPGIGCVLSPNALTQGTDQASPFLFATAYLVGNGLPALPAHGRPGVTTGIIFETDGTPQTTNFTCQQAQTAATAAKAAGIEVFTIGFFASNSPGTRCPDPSGTWSNRTIVQSLAAMATNSAGVTDGAVRWDREHRQRPLLLHARSGPTRERVPRRGGRPRQGHPARPAVPSAGRDRHRSGRRPACRRHDGQHHRQVLHRSLLRQLRRDARSVFQGEQVARRSPQLSPAHGAGLVSIVVSTPGGSSNSNNVAADDYTYSP